MTTVDSNAQGQSDKPVVVITGGTQGLGLALCGVLLEGGLAVSFCARTEADVNAARVLLTHGRTNGEPAGRAGNREPNGLLAMTGDIANRDFQRDFIEQTLAEFGRIDAVINNASTLGALPMPGVMNSTTENEAHVFDVNVFAPLQLIRLAFPHLVKQAQSLVIGISSDAAVGGYPGWSVYGASKAALDLFHKTLAAELTNHNVHVYGVDPGDMDTAMHHAADPGAEGLVPPALVAAALLPLFQPLKAEGGFPFASGSRLQVTRTGLVEASA